MDQDKDNNMHISSNPICNTFLPNEIIGYILTFVEIDDLYRMSLTSKENMILINDIIDTEYFMDEILKRQFKKKPILGNKLKNFINSITVKHKYYWINKLSNFYIKNNTIPQREIMLSWNNYDFLISSIINDDIKTLTFFFLTYKINSFFLTNVIDQLKYHNKIQELNLLINEGENHNIFNNSEICDIQINLYALPFIIGKNNIGELLLNLLHRRVGSDNIYLYIREIFTLWLHDDYQYLGNFSSFNGFSRNFIGFNQINAF